MIFMESKQLIAKALKKDFLTAEEGQFLFENLPTTELMGVANKLRQIQVSGNIVTWQIDRNVNTTNACTAKFIIFSEIRHTASLIVEKLDKVNGAKPVRFVGQGSREGDKGMTQKQQKAILDQFRNGDYNILVATSVGEEGLDIPSTDAVIFYEPVSSAIRLIQRRGRTGRNRPGEVFIFVTLGSRDEAALWSSRGKEQQMQDIFAAGRLEIDVPTTEELTGSNFMNTKYSVQTTFRKD